MKLASYSVSYRHKLGELILSGIDALESPYVLLESTGRLIYGNSQFFEIFGAEASKANVFVLLNNKLGVFEFSRSLVKDGVESLCIGIMQLPGQRPTTFRLISSKIYHNGKNLFQCVITQVKPIVALQIGLRDCELKNTEKLSKFIGAIAVEVDPQETGAHLLRTSRHFGCLCMALRDEGKLNATDRDIDLAVMCSIMHDMGKIHISTKILHKTSVLTEMEWGIIKGHVTAGMSIAQSLALPKTATDIIAFHHCRWDGLQDRWDAVLHARDPARGGYPFCTKGEAIPIWARAFAYVDIFDALITHRSYKPAWSIREAAGYIRDNLVGTHLDPGIYQAFIRSLQKLVVNMDKRDIAPRPSGLMTDNTHNNGESCTNPGGVS